jgi:hypothetical protein
LPFFKDEKYKKGSDVTSASPFAEHSSDIPRARNFRVPLQFSSDKPWLIDSPDGFNWFELNRSRRELAGTGKS